MKYITLLSLFLAGLVAGDTHEDGHHGTEGCPTDDSIPAACLAAVTPPFPVCLGATAVEWVAKAVDSSTRCCGDDISRCRCPVKDGERFREMIGAYCDAVENHCVTPTRNLRGGFD